MTVAIQHEYVMVKRQMERIGRAGREAIPLVCLLSQRARCTISRSLFPRNRLYP